MWTDASAHPPEMSAPSTVRARSPDLSSDAIWAISPCSWRCRGAVEPEKCCVPAQQREIEHVRFNPASSLGSSATYGRRGPGCRMGSSSTAHEADPLGASLSRWRRRLAEVAADMCDCQEETCPASTAQPQANVRSPGEPPECLSGFGERNPHENPGGPYRNQDFFAHCATEFSDFPLCVAPTTSDGQKKHHHCSIYQDDCSFFSNFKICSNI